MLNWPFKKRGSVAAVAVPVELGSADAAAQLRAAWGDDRALLQLAQSASVLDIKLAAVQALTAESALRQAEREFRSHDRKVHRVAKQRLEAAVEQRESRAKAQTLLERTRALLGEAVVPVNHVVALDRDWEALPAHALAPGQRVEFAELRARIDASMREHVDALQRLQRWTTDAERLLLEWQRVVTAAAELGRASDVARLGHAVTALRQTRPEVQATAELDLALAQAQQSADSLLARLASLEALPVNAVDPAAVAPPAADRSPRPAPSDARLAAQRLRLENLVQQAEAALAEGQLGAMQQHLQAIDAVLAKTKTLLPDTLRDRHQALWIERGRLKDWQQWGGARARDDLMAEADELARRTLAAADPAAPAGPKLSLKSHAENIHSLRMRWKELDHQGVVAGPEQWHAFDAALQTAHQPVAAQHAAQKAARQENLATRETLLAALEALPAPEAQVQPADGAPAWKACSRELERFQNAWRKLGPVEHTVPSASRQALQERLRLVLARIEAPLQAARAAAAAERERLIARAQSLVQHGGGGQPAQDAARQVRDLQAEWQDHARRLPLPRGLEAALWSRFKAATDAVFALRDAAFAARDVELATNLAGREALLQRLAAMNVDGPLADIERTLAEIDRAWRQDCALPRGAAEGLEGRFRGARAVASQWLAAAVRRRWQAQCDTLAAKLALCEEREGDDGTAFTDLSQRWALLDTLPAKWEQAVGLRWAQPVKTGPLPAAEIDDLLLRLEAALELPTAPEWQAARHNLKLRALKEAMEGRGSPKHGPTQQAEWLLATARQGGLDAAQRARLHALVAALRTAPPGSLGWPTHAG